MIESARSFKIIDYNGSLVRREALIKAKTDSFKSNKCYVSDFRIVKKFPAYIPKLVKKDDSSVFSSSEPLLNNIETEYSNKKFITDLAVAVRTPTTHTNTNIRYIPDNKYSSFLNVQTSTESEIREETIKNPYFHLKSSLELIRLVEEAIYKCVQALEIDIGPNDFKINKIESGRYQLYIVPTLLNQVTISFNSPLLQILPFDSKSIINNTNWNDIIFHYLETSINNITYRITQTLYKSVRIFPFNSVIFSSTGLNCEGIYKSANFISSTNNKEVELLNYYLNIDDPDEANDCISYSLSSLYNTLKINSSTINANFVIDCSLGTIDGYKMKLDLTYNEFVEVSLKFIE